MALDLTKLNPAKVIVELDRVDCAESLAAFVRLAWHVVDPGVDYRHNWHIDFICEHLEAITDEREVDGRLYNRLLINVPPGAMKPVWVEEPVMTNMGYVRLGDIKVGDMVLTHKGRFRRVEAVHDQGELPTVNVKTVEGTCVRTAPDHPFLSQSGWVEAEKLRSGDYVFRVTQSRIESELVFAVEPAEPAHCKCLTVEEDHSFTAGGLAVHNSLLVNVFWPAWEWGPRNKPHMKYLCAAHKVENLSARDSRRMRDLVTSDWYQARWGHIVKLKKDQNEKINFMNTAGGSRIATSITSLTGIRADRVIIDDPHSVDSALSDTQRSSEVNTFLEAVPTRLNDPKKSAIIVIMQRLHAEDVSGVIIDRKMPYDVIILPMRFEGWRKDYPTQLGYVDPREDEGELFFPARYPEDVIDDLEASLGSYGTAGQHQQTPVPRGGGVIKQAWWKLWDAPDYPALDYVVAYLDTAYTSKTQNDPSAMTIWGVFSGASVSSVATRAVARDGTQLELGPRAQDNEQPRVMLLHAWDERLEFHDLLRRVQKDVKSWHVDTLLIEDKAAGHSIAQELRRVFGNDGYSIRMDNPGTMDKVGRMYAVAHLFEEGLIWAPDKEWADKVIKQCEFVGRSARDDLADTTSGSLRFLRQTGMLVRGQEFAARQEDDMRYTGRPPEPLYPG